jgi:ABC-2 type transport system permease protein
MDTFISNEGLIKHLPAPLTVYALRTVWRQTLMLLHNMIVYVVMLAIFFTSLDHPYQMNSGGQLHPGLGPWSLTALPAFAVLALNGMWLTLTMGIISTRYRDIPQVINSVIQLAFYLTPIVWSPDDLFGAGHSRSQWAKVLFQLNPLYHFVQIMRAPLTGQHVDWWSWATVGGITVLGWGMALLVMRNYRARVSYWV